MKTVLYFYMIGCLAITLLLGLVALALTSPFMVVIVGVPALAWCSIAADVLRDYLSTRSKHPSLRSSDER